jgi:hypothetical protein
MTAREANVGDRIKVASYARWLKVVKKQENGELFAVHGGTQFTIPAHVELTKLERS